MSVAVDPSVQEVLPTHVKLELIERPLEHENVCSQVLEQHGVNISRFLFGIIFVVPVLVSFIYYGFVAADQYVSEARYVVRSVSAPNMPMAAGLDRLDATSSFGITRATDDAYAVNEYLKSRDVMSQLADRDHLREIFARPDADFANRFPNLFSGSTNEAFHRYFKRMITTYIDPESKIGFLQVRAFRPNDARAVADAALVYAEGFVNRLNERARRDSLRFTQEMADAAREKFNEAQDEITKFRNQQMLLDPSKQSMAGLELIAKIKSELAAQRTELDQAQMTSPDSPQIALMRRRVAALEAQIVQEQRAIVGSGSSMAPQVAEYELLTLNRDLAAKALSSALVSMESARQDLQKRQLYLERVTVPSEPDYPAYPKRFLMCLLVVGVAGATYLTANEVVKSAMQHVS